jgi:isoleucyl-tRNA synthetase
MHLRSKRAFQNALSANFVSEKVTRKATIVWNDVFALANAETSIDKSESIDNGFPSNAGDLKPGDQKIAVHDGFSVSIFPSANFLVWTTTELEKN